MNSKIDDHVARAIEYYKQEYGSFNHDSSEDVLRINELLFNDERFMNPERLQLHKSLERLKRGTDLLNMMNVIVGCMSLFVFVVLMASALGVIHK